MDAEAVPRADQMAYLTLISILDKVLPNNERLVLYMSIDKTNRTMWMLWSEKEEDSSSSSLLVSLFTVDDLQMLVAVISIKMQK